MRISTAIDAGLSALVRGREQWIDNEETRRAKLCAAKPSDIWEEGSDLMGVDSVGHKTAAKQEGERPANVIADWHAEMWESTKLFDWFVTFSFDEKTNRRYRLNRPERLHDFVEQRLREFGYWGPSVIVAHDNSKSRYYHAHCLLADYKHGMCANLTVRFRPFGNVSNADDGPIQGSGAFRYCANRAFPHKDADILSKESLRYPRRPRPRGRSRGRGTTVTTETAPHAAEETCTR